MINANNSTALLHETNKFTTKETSQITNLVSRWMDENWEPDMTRILSTNEWVQCIFDNMKKEGGMKIAEEEKIKNLLSLHVKEYYNNPNPVDEPPTYCAKFIFSLYQDKDYITAQGFAQDFKVVSKSIDIIKQIKALKKEAKKNKDILRKLIAKYQESVDEENMFSIEKITQFIIDSFKEGDTFTAEGESLIKYITHAWMTKVAPVVFSTYTMQCYMCKAIQNNIKAITYEEICIHAPKIFNDGKMFAQVMIQILWYRKSINNDKDQQKPRNTDESTGASLNGNSVINQASLNANDEAQQAQSNNMTDIEISPLEPQIQETKRCFSCCIF